MATRTAPKPRSTARRDTARKTVSIPGLAGIRIVYVGQERKLELRKQLDMPREVFSRLVNVSVRAIADVETAEKRVVKLLRPYNEVSRLCEALKEVVDPKALRDWFVAPNDAFDGLKPIEVIERGEIDRLWRMVYKLRSGMPG